MGGTLMRKQMMLETVITPPATVGILGGGQLALMLARCASQLGYKVQVLESSAQCPAAPTVDKCIAGAWSSPEVLQELASAADVITLENEFVDADVLLKLEESGHLVWPSSKTMRLVQDKLVQKNTLRSAGVDVVNFLPVENESDLAKALEVFGYPFVLKRRCLGYDGTGNFTVSMEADHEAALLKLGGYEAGLYAEAWCPYVSELAVIVTRSQQGDHEIYPVVETRQRNHVCETVLAPAAISEALAAKVQDLAKHAADSVGAVGSFGVEVFLLADGRVLVNELAPRVHNSGHYTIEACECSQFENHIRAVVGLPLGSAALRRPAAMVNLLGLVAASGTPGGLDQALALPGAHVHLYGKDKSKPGRKLGHITALGATTDEALAIAEQAAACIHFDIPDSLS
jgi:5-(carboxyamino)imidazole ribonucleotide synthase